jgi:hypothetical protein
MVRLVRHNLFSQDRSKEGEHRVIDPSDTEMAFIEGNMRSLIRYGHAYLYPKFYTELAKHLPWAGKAHAGICSPFADLRSRVLFCSIDVPRFQKAAAKEN